MGLINIIGWLGAFLLAFCGLPQAIKSIKDSHSDGISWLFIFMWLFGEIFGLIYIIPIGAFPVIFNYSLNILFVLIIFYYKIKPRKL